MMGAPARQLDADRRARDAARGAFDGRLAQVRADLEARGIGGRIADKVVGDVRDVFEETLEIIDENPGVVAGTIASVMIWLFRKPLIAWFEQLTGIDKQ